MLAVCFLPLPLLCLSHCLPCQHGYSEITYENDSYGEHGQPCTVDEKQIAHAILVYR